jgi:hypothetical protein
MGLTLSIGGSIGCHPAQGLEIARPAEDAMRLSWHLSPSRHAEPAGALATRQQFVLSSAIDARH